MEMIFHSHANKTHFLTEEMSFDRLCTQPHFQSEGFWNSEVAYFILVLNIIPLSLGMVMYDNDFKTKGNKIKTKNKIEPLIESNNCV